MKGEEMAIGQNIRLLRHGKNLTQYELGKSCGMADSQIGVYERGEVIPTDKTLMRIATALGVTIETLKN